MTTHHIGPAASTGATVAPLRSSTGPPKLERDLFIGNQWRPSSTGQTIALVNPATEQPFGRAAAASADDVDAAVQAARTAFDTGPWPRLSLQERAAALLVAIQGGVGILQSTGQSYHLRVALDHAIGDLHRLADQRPAAVTIGR